MVQHLTVVDHPLVQHKLTLMRKKTTSTVEFRQLLREISQFLAYEITRNLPMTTRRIETPIEEMDAPTLDGKKLALISILRAGNGLLDGVLELVPSARVGFVGLYRDEETLQPIQYYYKVPHGLQNRMVIAVDPMLATGQSLIAVYEAIKKTRTIDHLHIISVVASTEGIATIKESFPANTKLWIATIDDQLNDKGYIVPGLGDAGDLAFGTKL